jgi:periplasmic mercuric ion binding protein
MKWLWKGLALIGAITTAHAAVAAEQTATFAVENMTCAACPYIVKTSMAAVRGIMQVNVSFKEKTATVTFDDGQTSANIIAAASAKAGFPARLKDSQQESIKQ